MGREIERKFLVTGDSADRRSSVRYDALDAFAGRRGAFRGVVRAQDLSTPMKHVSAVITFQHTLMKKELTIKEYALALNHVAQQNLTNTIVDITVGIKGR